MGVSRGFWDVLKPVARLESLDSLRGKVLAIDLSFWMIQLLSRVKGVPLRKPHIRLLFFRTIHLVAKIGAFPVFVADGEPPPLKLEVRLNRFSRISGVPLNSFVGDPNSNIARNRNSLFTDNIDECVKLLELLGIPVLRAKHEAEGLCAELQRQGLVNACVTPDSDAFLYGAEHVIKIFQADMKDPHVESYMMRDIESFLGLHREHLVALALLAGCDYNVSGVPGIGCQNAIRLIKVVPKEQILNRLQDWGAGRFACEMKNGVTGDFTDVGFEKEGGLSKSGEKGRLKKEPHCSSCGHPGTKKLHTRLGCVKCQLEEGCRPKVQGFKCSCECCMRNEAIKTKMKQEGWKLKVCQKISATRGFPNQDIVEIFMSPEHDTLSGDRRPSLAWKSPHVEALEEFLEEQLRWDKAYVRRKLLPLLSFYCLKDTAALRNSSTPSFIAPSINGIYVPHSIQRIKILSSKPLYRLRWTRSTACSTQEDWLGVHKPPSVYDKKADDELDIMASDLQTESLDSNLLFTTDENMTLVKEAYPELVLRFEQEQSLRKSKKKGTSRKKITADDLSNKQLRITSFFQATKGTCSLNVKEKPQSEVQGSCLDKDYKGLEKHMRVEPWFEEAAYAKAEVDVTIGNQVRDACKMTRMTEVGIIYADDVLRDRFRGDENQYQYETTSTEVDLNINSKSILMQHSPSKPGLIKLAIIKNELEVPDSDIIQVYPCKANRLDNDSPGSTLSRERFSPCLKPTSLDTMKLDTTPPFASWRELYMCDNTKSSDSLKARSPEISDTIKFDTTPPFASWRKLYMCDNTKSSDSLKARSPEISARRALFN